MPVQSTVEIEISQITRENRNILSNLIQLEKEEIALERTKSDCLRQMARNYEKLIELGSLVIKVNEICSYLCKLMRTNNLFRSESLAHKVLDAKYKMEQFDPFQNKRQDSYNFDTRVPDSKTGFINNNGEILPEQSNFYYSNESAAGELEPTYDEPNHHVPIDYLLQKHKKPLSDLSNDELRDATERLIAAERKATEVQREYRRRKKENLIECTARKVALSPEYEQNNEPHISTEFSETGISAAWEAVEEFKELMTKLQDKLYKFKPPARMAKLMAIAVREECEFWRPMCDEKFRKDSLSWWEVECDNLWHGKHAAAIMNATVLDDKTKRSLTREQVGDRSEEALQRAIRFAAAQKMKIEFHKWYISKVEIPIAARAKKLHSVLSEKSFT